jgi:hypothetical protein
MKDLAKDARRRHWERRLILGSAMCALVVISALPSAAGNRALGAPPLITIAVTNNSSRDITHVYLSPPDQNSWSTDLLAEGTVLRSGQTLNIPETSCGANEIKVIAEDRQGCFVYGLVGCSQASASWTITDSTPTDCGN